MEPSTFSQYISDCLLSYRQSRLVRAHISIHAQGKTSSGSEAITEETISVACGLCLIAATRRILHVLHKYAKGAATAEGYQAIELGSFMNVPTGTSGHKNGP
ncbi:hypothetical protein QCA50_015442 [Cerrena zonata]|uniref:Uncharacterized protein n=1 Tax=Cerrena zonata TaxID=2478898 RepID=A0AAW0FL54_9APHY